MKISLRLLAALLPAIAGLVSGCAHDDDRKDFSPEELAELERKWGMEVCFMHPQIYRMLAGLLILC